MPPIEKPSRSTCSRPSARMKVTASFAIASMVFGVEPLGGADAAVVEGDDPVLGGDAVDDPRVPVVEDRGQVGEEDHRHAGRRAELAVGEVDAPGGDGAGRCVRTTSPRRLVFLVVGPRWAWLVIVGSSLLKYDRTIMI